MITKEQVDAACARWYKLANEAADAYREYASLREALINEERGDEAARQDAEE